MIPELRTLWPRGFFAARRQDGVSGFELGYTQLDRPDHRVTLLRPFDTEGRRAHEYGHHLHGPAHVPWTHFDLMSPYPSLRFLAPLMGRSGDELGVMLASAAWRAEARA
jgi:hypothetical protein